MPLSEETLWSLQNGSDIRGVAMAGEKPVNLSAETASAIAASFVRWLAAKRKVCCAQLRVGVGHDSRLTARELTTAILSGLSAEGTAGFDCGLASTPAMFMSTVFPAARFDGGIMVTASHLPADRNGMKFFLPEGGLSKRDIKEILQGAVNTPAGEPKAEPQCFDLMTLYCDDLKQRIIKGTGRDRPLEGLRIVVDAGNGAGGFYATRVLAPLGADITGSLYLDPDGTFPNHPPNPENKQAMACIAAATVQQNADLGLIFDTDVDRASAVLADGREIARDALIAMIAALIVRDYPGATVVTDSVTSDRLTEFLTNHLGLKHHRFKRGYKNVIDEAIRLQQNGVAAPLAIETSGHGALSENYYLDDGAYLATKLVIACANAKAEGKRLADLIAALPEGFEEREYRIAINSSDFSAYADEVLATFEQRAREQGLAVASPSYEGVRITFPEGWILLRKSLHDPLLPLNLEGYKAGDCDALLAWVRRLLEGFTRLDDTIFTRERK